MRKLNQTLGAIDTANAADPNKDDGSPAAQLYGQRMSSELERLFPDASDILKIAARGQHVERWILARNTYPDGKVGYHAWRRDLAKHHADRVGSLMAEAGYSEEEIAAAGRMLRKEGIKRHADVQALEDVICFVFLKWYFAPFAAKHSQEKVVGIVQKTARKMSGQARVRVLKEFDLPAELASAFKP
jgi:CRP-like cAMP-binding protein